MPEEKQATQASYLFMARTQLAAAHKEMDRLVSVGGDESDLTGVALVMLHVGSALRNLAKWQAVRTNGRERG